MKRRDPERDRGASLVVAIGFVVMIGTMTAGMSTLIQSSSSRGAALATVRNRQYAAEAAIEDAIVAVRGLDRTTTGACSAAGGVNRSTVNGFSIRVDWANACTAVKGGDGVVVAQRDVVFTACANTGLACTAATAIASAQVNFQQGASGGVTKTYVQSWSINGAGASGAVDTPTPIASWTFDTIAGSTTPDGSGTGPALSLTSTVSPVTGRAGSAMSFTGASPSALTSAAVVDTTLSFTVSTWVKVPSIPNCLYQTVVSQDGVNDSGFSLGLTAACNGGPAKFRFSMQGADADAATAYTATGTTSVVAGTWYHVVGVRDAVGGTMKLYVNGTLEGSATNTTRWAATGTFAVGRAKFSGTSRDWLLGTVDTTNVYSSALSASQVVGLP